MRTRLLTLLVVLCSAVTFAQNERYIDAYAEALIREYQSTIDQPLTPDVMDLMREQAHRADLLSKEVSQFLGTPKEADFKTVTQQRLTDLKAMKGAERDDFWVEAMKSTLLSLALLEPANSEDHYYEWLDIALDQIHLNPLPKPSGVNVPQTHFEAYLFSVWQEKFPEDPQYMEAIGKAYYDCATALIQQNQQEDDDAEFKARQETAKQLFEKAIPLYTEAKELKVEN